VFILFEIHSKVVNWTIPTIGAKVKNGHFVDFDEICSNWTIPNVQQEIQKFTSSVFLE